MYSVHSSVPLLRILELLQLRLAIRLYHQTMVLLNQVPLPRIVRRRLTSNDYMIAMLLWLFDGQRIFFAVGAALQ